MAKKITPRSKDYSRWYTDVIQRAEMADYAPVKGCMVIRPYGYALWENIKEGLDRRFKATGHVNAYFPLFIPQSFIQKEAEHVAGFSPELAVVTHGGGKKLEEPLIVRPTSETVIGHMYSQWVRSYRDLPLLINQWANVVRWEKRPRLFLRTTEFLWQEGHTAHATAEEAEEETLLMLEVYRDFAETDAAIPVITGRKSESEKFAGAVASYAIEAMMGNRWALQAGTSHFLGQNFARAFDIKYLDRNNELQYCWTTSWGVSTRMVGAVVMVHGDDQGLILPPKLAPIQLIIIPIWTGEEEKEQVWKAVADIKAALGEKVRYKVDDREEYSPGWKFNEWEMRGVPLRLEIGPRDVAEGRVTLARREGGEKLTAPLAPQSWGEGGEQEGLAQRLHDLLDDIQQSLFQRAKSFLDENSFEVDDYEEFKRIIERDGGFVYAYWCGSGKCEAAIKEDTKATIRCIPFHQKERAGRCILCGKEAGEQAVFARAY
ncbi:MAG: proline--tRNA ligase [Chloroflexi bacterium]|nr:proline--tRNA ligase [Chloroflexota bacterium]